MKINLFFFDLPKMSFISYIWVWYGPGMPPGTQNTLFDHFHAFWNNLKHFLEIEISTMKSGFGSCTLQRALKMPQYEVHEKFNAVFPNGQMDKPFGLWILQPHPKNRLVSDFWLKTSFWKNRTFCTHHIAFYKQILTKFGYELT